jgi:hypothetical protein
MYNKLCLLLAIAMHIAMQLCEIKVYNEDARLGRAELYETCVSTTDPRLKSDSATRNLTPRHFSLESLLRCGTKL